MTKPHAGTICVALLFIAMPWLTHWFLVTHVFHSSPDCYIPQPADETVFWIDAKAFSSHGCHSGYSGYEEKLGPGAKIGLGSFGAHGLVPYIFPALLAKFTGFTGYTVIVVANALAFALASCFFVYSARRSPGYLAFSTFLLFSLFNFHAFYGLNWQETLHFAVAVLLAALWPGAVTKGKKHLYLTASVIFFGALMRYSWLILFFPLFLSRRHTGKKDLSLSLLKAVSLSAASFVCSQLVASPFPYISAGPYIFVKLLTGQMALSEYIAFLKGNLAFLCDIPRDYPVEMVCQLIAFFFAATVLVAAGLRMARARKNHSYDPQATGAFWLVLFGPLTTLALSIGMYMPNSRMLMPVYLLAALACARLMPGRWYVLLPVAQLMLWPVSLDLQRDIHTNEYPPRTAYAAQKQTYKQFGDIVSKYLVFSKDGTPWCNTVLVFDWPRELLELPPGITTQFTREADKRTEAYKSKYVLVSTKEQLDAVTRTTPLKPLVQTPIGTLCLNLSSPCAGNQQ